MAQTEQELDLKQAKIMKDQIDKVLDSTSARILALLVIPALLWLMSEKFLLKETYEKERKDTIAVLERNNDILGKVNETLAILNTKSLDHTVFFTKIDKDEKDISILSERVARIEARQ